MNDRIDYRDNDGNYIGGWVGPHTPPDGGVPCSPPDDARQKFDVKTNSWMAVAPAIEDYQVAIQTIVDEAARSKLFNDGVTLASYVNSTVDQWAEQATAFVAWRDNVWQYAYSELAKVQGGDRDQPAVEAFLAELPEIVWP